MAKTTTLTMANGVKVVVPDSLEVITTYVLVEQQDWFEDEIKFLRRILAPGQNIIDIGANHGVYSLTMAQAIQPEGHLWAYEPASSTADILAESIAANGFANISLERCALSDRVGTATLSLHADSEMNAVVHDGDGSAGPCETIRLETLDHHLDEKHWRDIAFMKIDAEGEEANILKGGQRFFAELSPLIQYEVKIGIDINLDLVDKFAALGYDSYRLVAGLDVLVPFDKQSPCDEFLLNLFCCKPDRAAQLAAQGRLVLRADITDSADDSLPADLLARYHWRETAAKLPYGAAFSIAWDTPPARNDEASRQIEQALALHACSQDETLPAALRFRALESAFTRLRRLCENDPSHLRLASLARVAREYGARIVAVAALSQLIATLLKDFNPDLSEPFLPPQQRFDTVAPGEQTKNWIAASALEALELAEAYSSFYTGNASKQRLRVMANLGFASKEMTRRLYLVEARFPDPAPAPG